MRLLKPQDRIVFTFAEDSDIPMSTRPKLIGKVLSVSEARKMVSLSRRSDDRGDDIERIIDAVMGGLTGWECVNHPETGEPIPFSREALAAWLTMDELCEALEFLAGRLTAGDKKKSESPHSSGAANCAPVAPVAVAS